MSTALPSSMVNNNDHEFFFNEDYEYLFLLPPLNVDHTCDLHLGNNSLPFMILSDHYRDIETVYSFCPSCLVPSSGVLLFV